MTSKILCCPFCGGNVDPAGWLRGDGVRGPECEDCGATASSMDVWNKRAAPEAPRQEPVAWGAWRKSLDRFHCIECNVDYMQRTYGKDSEDMGVDFELVPLYRHPVPLSPDHSGGVAGVVLPERECEDCFQNDQSEQAIGFNRALDKVKELNQ